MQYIREHINQVIISVIFAIIGVFLSILPYFAIANIIRLLIEKKTDINVFVPMIILALIGFIGGIAFHEISTITSHNLAFRIIESTRKKLAEKLDKLSMGTIESKSSGAWTQFMVETLDKMEKPIAHVIPEVIANLLVPVVIVICIFIMDWRIGLANLITLPLGMLFSMLMMSGYKEKSKNYIEASKKMNATVVEYIKGIKVVKAFNQSASSYEKFGEAVAGNRDAMLNWYLTVCFAMTAAMEVLPSTLLFVLPVSLMLFMKGSIGAGTMVMCILLSYASYKPLIKAMTYVDTIANVRVIFAEIGDIMNLPELKRPKQNVKVNGSTVKFCNVSFGYDENLVFENLNLIAKEGELTAIVGPSGSGKSTIAKLIAGFWNVNKGDIKIGGAKLSNMPLGQNMELVTYVSQENFLFNQSIIDNMKMAKPNATLEEIQEACRKASCHDFIMSLPKQYNTIAGDSGSHFSGGERQRLTIARALLKDSPIILLDEATAYSDPENEDLIQKSISALVKSKTVIMIAHRLSTIVNANKIYILNEGNIEAAGTHKELLSSSPLYNSMWRSHLSAKDRGEEIKCYS
ncbi:ABC transporter ATP-binding protein [Clostridium niameyense]|uniref:ABC transporter ATP-binding protein n=1 Tax=Clostridium niameyense TaxID=1622073 RepID=A0A6M0RAJ0_9CLOT|nr:ABC transporter ATP-binding protein [Clostridium niameyense]NEZ47271.1 ABC transporter ATP-binding protein [Clostridium niameyense]